MPSIWLRSAPPVIRWGGTGSSPRGSFLLGLQRGRAAGSAHLPEHDPPKTRRAYKFDVEEFIAFVGLGGIAELRSIPRAHVIAWRKDLERRELAHPSIRRKLSAL